MSPISRKWSTDITTKFLLAYEQYPCLWNPKHGEYTHTNQRYRALQNLVKTMLDLVPDFDISYARAKIRSLRNAYILEHHKIVNSIRNYDGTGNIYKPKLRWFPLADRFLSNIVEPRNKKKIWNLRKTEYSDESQDAESSKLSHILDIEDNEVDCFSSVETTATPFSANLSSTSSYFDNSTFNPQKQSVETNFEMKIPKLPYEESKKYRHSNMSAPMIDPLETPHIEFTVDPLKTDSFQNDPDEFELFGKTVAAHLRQMPLNVALESQCKILNYLVCRRLGREGSL